MKVYNYIIIAVIFAVFYTSEGVYSNSFNDLAPCIIICVIGLMIPHLDYMYYKYKYRYQNSIPSIGNNTVRFISDINKQNCNKPGFFHSAYGFILTISLYFYIATYGEEFLINTTNFNIRPWFWIFGIGLTLSYMIRLTIDLFTDTGFIILLTEFNNPIKSPYKIPNTKKRQRVIFIILSALSTFMVIIWFVVPTLKETTNWWDKMIEFLNTTWKLITTGHQ